MSGRDCLVLNTPITSTVLELCVRHVSPEDRDTLHQRACKEPSGRVSGPLPRVMEHHYGWLMPVPDLADEVQRAVELARECPSVYACLELAHTLHCAWLYLDTCRPAVKQLPTYEYKALHSATSTRTSNRKRSPRRSSRSSAPPATAAAQEPGR